MGAATERSCMATKLYSSTGHNLCSGRQAMQKTMMVLQCCSLALLKTSSEIAIWHRWGGAVTAYLLCLSRGWWVLHVQPDHHTHTANSKTSSPVARPGNPLQECLSSTQIVQGWLKTAWREDDLQEAHQKACNQPDVVALQRDGIS